MSPGLVKFLVSGLINPRTSHLAKPILNRLKLKYVNISVPQRIGHLALEGDCFLRDQMLKTGRPPVAVMVEPTHGGFANPVLAEYLSRYIAIIPRIAQGDLVDQALIEGSYAVHTAPYAVAMYDTALAYDVYRRWGRRAPLFTLTRGDRAATARFLRAAGVPEGAWFVCVHARAGGYSPSDEHWHAHRNVDIADYGEAIDRIVARGGWCIRMGDATMDPMPTRERVIDYARSEFKSPRLDIGLTASCRFFLGCASGLYNVAAMFGRPAALANMTPLAGAYALGVEDLAIPQGIVDTGGRPLAVEEVFASNVADYRLAEEFRASGLSPRNATPGEIAALADEMMDRLDGMVTYTADDEARQERFRAYLRPGHYAYGTGSRLGRDYLRAHLDSANAEPAANCSGAGKPLEAASILYPETPMGESEIPSAAEVASLYGPDYYAHHCGPVAYDRSRPEWASFFGNVADELIRVFRPRRVFDAGCAHGFLVEALWDRGVEAKGRDISDFAISQVRPDLRPYCAVGSLADPIEGTYDLAVSIEVLEHMTEADGLRAIANLAAIADHVVFSSSPSDFDEPTHINVKPPLYWMRAFAEHNFTPTIAISFPSLTPHAIAFARAKMRPTDEHLGACAEVIRCRIQRAEDARTIVALSAQAGSPDGERRAREDVGFDASYYLDANPDVHAAGRNPLEHYVTDGRREGRFPNAFAAYEAEQIAMAYRDRLGTDPTGEV